MDLVCGIDVGTSGARALAVDREGRVVARAEARFEKPPYVAAPGLSEQDALEWWTAVRTCLAGVLESVGRGRLLALAVDSTSGTFVPVDKEGNPLIPALMYNDGRATGLEGIVNEAARELTERLGYAFPPAFSLVKLVWLLRHRPDVIDRAFRFLHAADFIVGKLTGSFDITDTSNALKSGVDLLSGTWPDFIEEKLGLPLSKFPRIFRPGERVGEVSREAAGECGLEAGTVVVAGASDGTASFLASGARAVGDWNLTLGTTLAIRGISKALIRDPLGRLYCHRHPEGAWLPGGASNVGGEALLKVFGGERLADLDRRAEALLPSGLVVYPLIRRGERMPFVSDTAEGFELGVARDETDRYAAYLEGIALVAAWSVEEARDLGAEADGAFFLSGGGGRGKTLGRLMATALGKTLVRPREPDAAMGSALLAAGWAWFGGSVSAAQAAMVADDEVFEPFGGLVDTMKEKKEALKEACRKKGYLSPGSRNVTSGGISAGR
jgi:D-ribulokinase